MDRSKEIEGRQREDGKEGEREKSGPEHVCGNRSSRRLERDKRSG